MAAATVLNFGKTSITPDWIKINVKNFHGSLTTVVMAQNDTFKTAKHH